VGVLGSLAAAGGLAYGILHHGGKSAFETRYPAADHQVQQVEGNLLGSLAGSGSGHPLTPSTVDAAARQVSAADQSVRAVPVPRELAASVSQLRSGLAQQHQELKQLSAALRRHQVGVANRKHVALLGQALSVSGAANDVAAAAGLPPANGPASSTTAAPAQGENGSTPSAGASTTSSPAQGGGIVASTSQTESLPAASSGSTASAPYLGVNVQLANETATPRLVLPTSIPSLTTSTGRTVQPALSYTDTACSASTSAALTGVVLAPGQKLTTCVPFQLTAGEQPQRFGYQLESVAAAEPTAQSLDGAAKTASAPAREGAAR
jgi:hypothetical protein